MTTMTMLKTHLPLTKVKTHAGGRKFRAALRRSIPMSCGRKSTRNPARVLASVVRAKCNILILCLKLLSPKKGGFLIEKKVQEMIELKFRSIFTEKSGITRFKSGNLSLALQLSFS